MLPGQTLSVTACAVPPLPKGEASGLEKQQKRGVRMTVRKNSNMLPRAKELRRDMTPQERKLWYLFLQKYPVKIYKQRIIESYIVDFYCASAKLVIEIDGSQHYTDSGTDYDQQRSRTLERYGLQVLRFSNREINTQFPLVCQAIHQAIQERRGDPPCPTSHT